MKTNMGYIDRFIRISIALIIAVLSFTNVITGVLATLLAILAGIFVVTSFIGFCPLYLPFGISTRKKSPEKI